MPTTPSELLDPELRALLATIPQTENGMFDLNDIPAARETARAMVAQTDAQAVVDPSVTIETLEIPRPPGSPLSVRVFRPENPPAASSCLMWFHPGGQVLGTANDEDGYLAGIAAQIGCVVASVDYRLAPENPAPAAAEDGYLAYHHLVEHARDLGLNPEAVGIAGASGGGAIAATTAIMIRDRGVKQPLFLSLSYAMLDDRNTSASSHAITDIGIWDRKTNILAWRAVLGDRADGADVPAYCAPARARNLQGLPPTFVAAAEFDVFRDEDLDFAARLAAAAVPVEVHLYKGAFHSWDRFAPHTDIAQRFNRTWREYITRHFAAGPSRARQ